MTPHRIARRVAGSAAGAVLLVPGLVGCGSDGDDADALCSPANDYVWYVGYFVGEDGGPPSADEIPGAVDTMVDLSDELVDEVPSDREDEADTAHRTWTGAQDVLAKYDLADDSTADEAVAALQAELATYQASNESYVAWLRDECGFDSSADLDRPEGA